MVSVSDKLFFKKYNVINFSWNKWNSNIIKSVSQSHWSHSGIIVKVTPKSIFILESVAKTGVSVHEYSRKDIRRWHHNKTIEMIDFEIDKASDNMIWKKYVDNKTTYGFESVLAIVLYKFGFSTSFNFINTVICSELVAKLLYELSDKYVQLGKKKNENPGEFDLEYWRIQPKHISLSKYGKRLKLNVTQ